MSNFLNFDLIDVAIMMKNVYVGWEKNVPFLNNLNFEIKKKKLYAGKIT